MSKKIMLMLIVVPISSQARFAHLGARAMGMGGAQVAVVNDASAVYWNPAVMAFMKPYFAMDVNTLGYVGTYGSFLNKVNDILSNYDMDYVINVLPQQDELTPQDIGLIVSLTKDIYDFLTSTVFLRAGILGSTPITVKNFGTGMFGFYEAGAWLKPDFENVGSSSPDATTAIERLADAPSQPSQHFFSPQLRESLVRKIEELGGDWALLNPKTGRTYAVDYVYRVEEGLINGQNLPPGTKEQEFAESVYKVAEAARKIEKFGGGYTYDLNSTGIVLKTLFVTEVPISYAYKVKDYLSVGGSFKIMYGLGYEKEVRLIEPDADWGTILDEMFTFGKGRTNVGIDLSVFYRTKIASAGLLLRNINFPSFKTNLGRTIRVYPTIRAGAGISPLSFLTLAIDLDLYPAPTLYSDAKDMELSVGLEFNVASTFYFRSGYTHNLMVSNELGEFGLGMGFNIIKVRLDLGVTLSNFTDVKGYTLPTSASAECSIVMKF